HHLIECGLDIVPPFPAGFPYGVDGVQPPVYGFKILCADNGWVEKSLLLVLLCRPSELPVQGSTEAREVQSFLLPVGSEEPPSFRYFRWGEFHLTGLQKSLSPSVTP